MYLREFMRLLAVVKDHPGFQEWYVKDDELRCLIKVGATGYCEEHCPITAVELCKHDMSHLATDYEFAVQNLQMPQNTGELIVNAADFPDTYDGWDEDILSRRKKVLRNALLNVTQAKLVT